MAGRLAVLACIALGLLAGSAAEAKKKKADDHPGCAILWFLEGCPLGNTFGVDPFRVYPWKNLCRKYPRFHKLDQCQKYLKTEEEAEEDELVEAHQPEDAPPAEAEVVKKKPSAPNKKKQPKPVEVKEPEVVPVKAGAAEEDLVIGGIGPRIPSRVRRRVHQYHQFHGPPSHPGCTHFWFLPGCPLGEMVVVDPFGSYPWDKLCAFEKLRTHERCQGLRRLH